MARGHPGETPTSFIVQGLIDFLVGEHPVAQELRKYVAIKIIPMLNPDGAFLGNERCSAIGADLNRVWNDASQWGHPTVFAAKAMLHALDADKSNGLELVLDLHAHNSLLGCFVYGTTYEDVYRYERHIVFPKLLALNCEDFSASNTIYNRDPLKQGAARRYLCAHLSDAVNSYSVLVSLYGYRSRGDQVLIPYTEEAYMRLGRDLGHALLDYFRAMQVIPSGGGGRGSHHSGERPQPQRLPAASAPVTRSGEPGAAVARAAAAPLVAAADPTLDQYPLPESAAASSRSSRDESPPPTPALKVRVQRRSAATAAPPIVSLTHTHQRHGVVRSYISGPESSSDEEEEEEVDAPERPEDAASGRPPIALPARRLAYKSVDFRRLERLRRRQRRAAVAAMPARGRASASRAVLCGRRARGAGFFHGRPRSLLTLGLPPAAPWPDLAPVALPTVSVLNLSRLARGGLAVGSGRAMRGRQPRRTRRPLVRDTSDNIASTHATAGSF